MTSRDQYKSRDLYLAAYLKAMEIPLLGTETRRDPKTKKKVIYFIFEGSPRIQEMHDSFFAGRAVVNALAYADSLRNLKAVISSLLGFSGSNADDSG